MTPAITLATVRKAKPCATCGCHIEVKGYDCVACELDGQFDIADYNAITDHDAFAQDIARAIAKWVPEQADSGRLAA